MPLVVPGVPVSICGMWLCTLALLSLSLHEGRYGSAHSDMLFGVGICCIGGQKRVLTP